MQNQRLVAAKLARQFNAPKTLAIINDETKNSPLDTILKSAVDEVGIDKVISVILDSEYNYWALGALRYLPDLGPYEPSLRKKVGIVSNPLVTQPDAPAVKPFPGLYIINQFEMYMGLRSHVFR